MADAVTRAIDEGETEKSELPHTDKLNERRDGR